MKEIAIMYHPKYLSSTVIFEHQIVNSDYDGKTYEMYDVTAIHKGRHPTKPFYAFNTGAECLLSYCCDTHKYYYEESSKNAKEMYESIKNDYISKGFEIVEEKKVD